MFRVIYSAFASLLIGHSLFINHPSSQDSIVDHRGIVSSAILELSSSNLLKP